jgi:aspartate-semialdehyde dehydrogenase
MQPVNVAVFGCTGMVGQQFVRMLENHPFFRISGLFSSSASAGKIYGEHAEWVMETEMPPGVKKMPIREFDMNFIRKNDIRLVFSALPASIARRLEGEIRRDGIAVFSNASAFRMDGDVPILIPEVNESHLLMVEKQKLMYGGFVVTNSNCSTSGLVMALRPITGFGIRSVSVSTYQAISGGGLNGVRAMEIQGNILPFIKGEEEKMVAEAGKILGKFHPGGLKTWDVAVNASCCRVPVRNGHLESVTVELEDDADPGDLINAWTSFRGGLQSYHLPTAPMRPIIFRTEENRPQPLVDGFAGDPHRARGMAVTLGRLRKRKRWIQFFLLVNNTIRGAAGTCILNAELACKKNLIPEI